MSRFAAVLLGAALAPLAVATAAGSPEARVKATYLYKFVPFVEWPATAFASPAQPVVLCLLGGDPFGAVLDQAVHGQKIGPRPIVVRRLARPEKTAGCHILYLSNAHGAAAAGALQSTHGAPVLTVTDGADSVGGVVNFVLRDNRVRFMIDTQAAAANGLTISSKLLSLALDARAGR